MIKAPLYQLLGEVGRRGYLAYGEERGPLPDSLDAALGGPHARHLLARVS